MNGVVKTENIQVIDAYENNLKHISVEIEPNKITCVTGVSGSGKSSLVYDTLYAESQRNFLESMSSNMFGQKIMDKPNVKSIENLPPALAVSQNYYNNNPRSTVGTLTDISHYLRTLFALIINSEENTNYTESFFSSNNPEVCCPYCDGIGQEYDIDESAVIPDKKKSLQKGAIIYYKGSPNSEEHKLLLAICNYYDIDPEKTIEELTHKELYNLLYRTEEISLQVSFKTSKGKYRKKVLKSKGALIELNDKLKDIDTPSTKISISKYIIKKQCSHCNGLKLKPIVLSKKICDYNIAEVEKLKITALSEWITIVKKQYEKYHFFLQCEQLIDSIQKKIESIVLLNIDYLSVDRSVPTLSGGEIQRIRIANQLNCPLRGLLYILDEPCRGLHIRNIDKIIAATNNLVSKGNTVLSIEHNPYYISNADKIIELGPVGGKEGGYITYNGKINKKNPEIIFKKISLIYNEYFELNNVNFHNLRDQTITFPLNTITAFTGVSGSGKSSLATVIEQCIAQNKAVYCASAEGLEKIKAVRRVNQQPIGKNSRSTIVSYLEIFDIIRTMYADQSNGLFTASDFSMNVAGGRCERCQGNGTLKIELNYLPESYIKCPECNGKRFKPEILNVKLFGRNIFETLSSPIQEIIDDLKNIDSIHQKLKCMVDVGLGYLCLGQMSMHLSGGEAQRIKLAKVLGTTKTKNTLFILDEPTAGLNESDITKIKNVIETVKEMGNTIIVIDHNATFVASISDYMIDFGKYGGDMGGTIVAYGFPKDVYDNHLSSWNK